MMEFSSVQMPTAEVNSFLPSEWMDISVIQSVDHEICFLCQVCLKLREIQWLFISKCAITLNVVCVQIKTKPNQNTNKKSLVYKRRGIIICFKHQHGSKDRNSNQHQLDFVENFLNLPYSFSFGIES